MAATTPFNVQTDIGGNGVGVTDIKDAYLSGNIAATNGLIARAGMSQTGMSNVLQNMGYPSSLVNDMQGKGIIFAAAGSPQEDKGWNTNAVIPAPATPAATPAPNTLSGTQITAAAPATIAKPTAWTVTPDQTVEGRIGNIVNPNNPLMVQAETQANSDANARGLINSSMATSAGQDAMYRAALPIATADAATYGKAAGYNADQANQVALQNAQMKTSTAQANLSANTQWAGANLNAQTTKDVAGINTASQQKIASEQNQTQLAQTGMQGQTQRDVATLNADSQQKIATLDSATRTQIQQLQNQNSTLLNTNQQASQAFNQYVVAASNIQNNPNLDAANKTTALQTLWQTTQTQLQVLAHVSGLDLTGMLDMTQFSAPVSTPAPTAAPVPEGGIISRANGL